VGLVPLFTVEVLEDAVLDRLPGFKKRLEWFLRNRKDLARHISYCESSGHARGLRLLAVPSRGRLERMLGYLADESEFLAPGGVRSLSAYHREHPYVFHAGGREHRVDYAPAESTTGLFGGNSNWRGPIWLPINMLILRGLLQFYLYYGDAFRIECPTGSGRMMNLFEVTVDIARRLTRIFLRDEKGRRPVYGGSEKLQTDPHWRDYILFYEYFHGDNGAGLGAGHQTGWTGLVAKLIQMLSTLDPQQVLKGGTRPTMNVYRPLETMTADDARRE